MSTPQPSRSRLRAAAAICAASLVLGGCYSFTSPIGVPLPDSSRFENEWKNYGRLKHNKAMCVAGDMSGVYVTGYSFGAATELGALEAAMTACEARRVDKRIDAPCRTYAVGDVPSDRASNSESIVR
jgi:hypothetical protein